jgi:hypothetical protein
VTRRHRWTLDALLLLAVLVVGVVLSLLVMAG